jgi:hypothetical protein
VAHLRRWLPFAAAALSTALLAVGFGLGANRLVTPRSQPAPQLRTVSATALSRVGVTLAAPAQPPYCGLADAAAGQGWLRSGSAGCAISQTVAESAARQGGNVRVVESLLAQVTSSKDAVIGRNHLAWLVVTQQTLGACQQPATGWSICLGGRGGFAWNQLVLVDARSAGIVHTLRISPMGRGTQTFPPGTRLPGASVSS